MGIKQKFTVLAGIIGVLLAVVSIIGFYTADSNLEKLALNVSAEGVRRNAILSGERTDLVFNHGFFCIAIRNAFFYADYERKAL